MPAPSRRARRPVPPAGCSATSPVTHLVGAGVPDGPYRRTAEYRRILVYPSVGAGVPDGPYRFSSVPPIGGIPRFRARVTFGRSGPLTFLFHASGGPISFSSERNGGKNAAKNQWFLEFLSSDHSHAAKRPTPNRSCPYPRCRFHVPQGNAVSYRRGTVYLRVVRRSGSDKRTARDSLYDDVRQFKSRVVRGGGFQRTPAAQEVLKPAVSSSVFGHFWGCGQK